MSNTALKNTIWMSLPLALAMGCAQNRTQTAAVYSDVPASALAPTSDRPAEQVYAGKGSITRTTPPSGVSADDWTLNQNVSALFLENRKLAPPPSEVTAVVDQKEHGVVHLTGHIVNSVARRRVIEAVSKVPGVTRVDDRMVVGARQPTGEVDLRAPPQ